MSARRPYETLSRETRFRCPYWHLRHDRYRLPGGGVGDYYYVHTGGSTMVVPVTGDGRLVLVRQYRYLLHRESEEFPCGGMELTEDPEVNARKELREEAGFEAGRLQGIGSFAPYNGVADELCRVYLAWDLRRVPSAPEATEAITVVYRSPAEVSRRIEAGEIWDGMTIAAFYLATPYLAALTGLHRFGAAPGRP